MKKKIILVILFLSLLFAGIALAQPMAFSLPWWTVDGGGGRSESANFSLEGTIGQAEAGAEMQSLSYSLSGGFWAGGEAPHSERIYLPVVVNDNY